MDHCLKKKNKRVTGLMEDELGGKTMIQFARWRAKIYSYLTDVGSEDKKAKETKNCVMKRKLNLKTVKIMKTV